MKNIKWFRFEPSKFISDIDYQLMSAEERGIYFTLILYLYTNSGRLIFDKSALIYILNCSESAFENFCKKYIRKFNLDKDILTHKRVTEEVSESQAFHNKQVMKANKRWKNSMPRHMPRHMPMHESGICQNDAYTYIHTDIHTKEINKEKFPFLLDELFKKTFDDFLTMRLSIKKKATSKAQELVLKKLHTYDITTAKKMLEESIMNSWQGVFPLKEQPQKSTSERML